MNRTMKRIEEVLDTKVRPEMAAHGGGITVDHLEGKVLHVKLQGQCAGCPSSDLTTETLVEAELLKAVPDLVEKVVVVQHVSDELWDMAKRLLRDHKL
jgi:Fe/S biogenesis protein NfuA